MRSLPEEDRLRIRAVIGRHLDLLRNVRGFVAAAPGFPLSGGRLVREPAIIVFVTRKLPGSHLETGESVPPQIEGVRVDVMTAPPSLQLPVDAALEAATPTYQGIPGNPIDKEFAVKTRLLCHVGPDSGWIVFRDFVTATQQSLDATIYDFNADYIANSLIETAEESGMEFQLSIDDGMNAAEKKIQKRLTNKLPDTFEQTVIICRAGLDFPSAYHEKVAVRDKRSFWLSSGNWSLRSQPEIDPIHDPDDASGMYGKGNREWHVIVEDEQLAAVFARYMHHDRERAQAAAAAHGAALAVLPSVARPDLFVPIEALAAADAALAVAEPVDPARLPTNDHQIVVRPVLSPDNYAKRIDELVRSAKKRLYLQYAYITWTDAARDAQFTKLLRYLGDLSWKDDFDLRVIVGSNDAAEKTRLLAQEGGWNDAVVRGQRNIHNKGIVADGKSVLISSQNWSGDGFLRNRDAGLIIHDTEIAGYYERVFLDDWESRARSPFSVTTALVAGEGESPPPGMVRVTWKEFYGDDA